MTSTLLKAAVTALTLLTMAACDGAQPGEKVMTAAVRAEAASAPAPAAAPTGPTLRLPPTFLATVGTPLQLATQASGTAEPPVADPALAWSGSDRSIATVDPSGRVVPLRAGVMRVAAALGDASASATLVVRSATPIPVRSVHVGTNLAGIAYFGTQFPFANMLRMSEGWSLVDDKDPKASFAPLAADGYPTRLEPGQHARAAVAWGNTHYPAGRYVVLWDGDGTLSTPLTQSTVTQTSPNRLTVDVRENPGPMFVGIDRTNPANPVRNVRFLWPGTEATYTSQPFTPEFLKKTAPFSVLRFMDWGSTNGSPQVNWADRARLDAVHWSGDRGVPLELMIDLANELHVDPWFCIPHQANDDYVTRFAMLVRDRLDPALKPHIEYSNEVWNQSFAQSRWSVSQATALGLPRPLNSGAVFYAQRSVEVFRLVQRVFGPDKARVVRVLAGQAAWTAFSESALAWKDTAANVDVLAIAPYFTAGSITEPEQADATLALTPEQVLDRLLADVRGNIKAQMQANAALAKKYKLRLVAYESGAGDTTFKVAGAKGDAVTALFSAANRLPRMHAVYTEYYTQWVAAGGSTMNQYNDIGPWTKWGTWGALEYLTQEPAASPKYRALLDFIAAHPTPPR